MTHLFGKRFLSLTLPLEKRTKRSRLLNVTVRSHYSSRRSAEIPCSSQMVREFFTEHQGDASQCHKRNKNKSPHASMLVPRSL
jgi:hypothetical protein